MFPILLEQFNIRELEAFERCAKLVFIQSGNGYYKNLKKRLLKQPKLHIIDTLLLQHSLSTNFQIERAKNLNIWGQIYESFITSEIIKTLENNGIIYSCYNWRTADKAEVDLILEVQGKIIPFEIKSSANISKKDISGLKSFLKDNPNSPKGYIIYPGKEKITLSSQIEAIPDWWLLGFF